MSKSLRLCTALLVTTLACGSPNSPSESVTGDWMAPSGHTDSWGLHLSQSGDTIVGVTCVFNFAQQTPTIPVGGQYPHVRFTYNNRTFDGKYEKDRDQIAGDVGTGLDHFSVRFSRTDKSMCATNAP